MTTYMSMPGLSVAHQEKPLQAAASPAPANLEGGFAVEEIPLDRLPPLPERSLLYWTQPFAGIVSVGFASAMCLRAAYDPDGAGVWKFILVTMFALVATFCLVKLLVSEPPDQVKRSKATCYPMPGEIAMQLKSSGNSTVCLPTKNINGPSGSSTLGTYCVRCLVWRPPTRMAGEVHHCSVCQRCYTGFDHHCAVIGRCIVNSNLLWFYLLIAMLPAGLITAVLPDAPPWTWSSVNDVIEQSELPYPFNPPELHSAQPSPAPVAALMDLSIIQALTAHPPAEAPAASLLEATAVSSTVQTPAVEALLGTPAASS